MVSENIPKLIDSLTEILYGERGSAKYDRTVANSYKTLVDSGMTKEQAFELTQQYMNLAGMIGKAIGKRRESK
ncbi:MAG: hypothetical protein ACE5KV_00890 [Thermoplasmata archaeon]